LPGIIGPVPPPALDKNRKCIYLLLISKRIMTLIGIVVNLFLFSYVRRTLISVPDV
jgi:hypothetical protein